MPSIKINHCLICDTAREEARNKISLLGFFGVTPNVEVRLDTFELPVNELTLVFIGSISGSAGRAEVTIELFDYSDRMLFSHSQSSELQPKERANFIFNIRLLKFVHPGRHKIRLRIDGRPVYNTDFLISRNVPTP